MQKNRTQNKFEYGFYILNSWEYLSTFKRVRLKGSRLSLVL